MAAKRNQRTIKASVELSGVGIHTGAQVSLKAKPADPDTGVQFVRSDLPDAAPIPATLDYVQDNLRRTTLRNAEAEVHTIEHLLATLAGLGLDNLEIELDGPEVPAMDGSSLPFLEVFQAAGTVEQKVARKLHVVEEPIFIAEGGASISCAAHQEGALRLAYTLDYPNTSVGSQFLAIDLDTESFTSSVAPARTFCFAQEIEALKERGLGKGADYSNTLVIEDGRVVENQLRYEDEYVRHKILDLLGDLFLLNADLEATVHATKSGHQMNRLLVRHLADQMAVQETRGIVGRETGMDIKQILNLLPHRYPFLLIDRVIELEGYRRAVGIKNVTINEPFFQGHWPEQPIMPGVLILEAMAQLSGVLLLRRLENTGKLAVLWSIDKVKLRKAVVPGDQLRIEIEATKVRDTMGQVAARGKVNQELVAEARLTFTLVDAT